MILHQTSTSPHVKCIGPWLTQRLSTFISTQSISQHVDVTFDISTEEWNNKHYSASNCKCNLDYFKITINHQGL